jgi:antitoxin MazE
MAWKWNMVTKVQKWGNSQGVRLPKEILAEAKLTVGDVVQVSVQNDKIIVEPLTKVRGKHDITNLVAKIPKSYRPEEVDWGGAIGKEAW